MTRNMKKTTKPKATKPTKPKKPVQTLDIPLPDADGNCPTGWYNDRGKCILDT